MIEWGVVLARATNQESTDVHALLDEHAWLTFDGARDNDVDFHMEIIEGFGPTSLGMWAASLLGLVGNARQATVEKSRSNEESRDAAPLTLVTRRSETCREICINDNGSGVSPESIETTFRPFFATGQTDRDTGHDLALPGDVVRRRGSEISEGSEPRVLTELLPAEPQSEPDEHGIADTPDNGPEHIT